MRKYHGMILPVTMVLLLVTTLAAVSALDTLVVGGKVSSAYRHRMLARNSAELALLKLEGELSRGNFSIDQFDDKCSQGLCFHGQWNTSCLYFPPEIPVWKTDIWANDNSGELSDVDFEFYRPVKYLIEFLCHAPFDVNTRIQPYVDGDAWRQEYGELYRISVLSVVGNARVMLQSIYLRE